MRPWLILVAAGIILAGTSCGRAAPAAPVTVHETVTHTVADSRAMTTSDASTHTAVPATGELESAQQEPTKASFDEALYGQEPFVMPDEVGQVLQSAQDDMQRISGDPFYFTDSRDATGAGRMQVMDRNWKVCAQSVPPGTLVTPDIVVTFAAVKLSESC